MNQRSYPGRELELFALAKNWKRYVADLVKPYLVGEVLEVGAGIGETTRVLYHSGLKGWTCLEPDAALAHQIGGRLDRNQQPAVEIIHGTICDLMTDRHFDSVIYIDVLEHIKDDRDELQMAAGHLKPNGRIVVLSPAFQLLFSEFDHSIGHYRRYTKRSLAAVFPSSLRRERLVYADGLGMMLSLANRVLLKQSLPSSKQIQFWDSVVVPLSRRMDWAFRNFVGRSVIAVYRRPA